MTSWAQLMVVMKAENLRTEPRRVEMMDSSYRWVLQMVAMTAELTKKATGKALSLGSSYPSAPGKVEMTARHLQKGHSTVETKVDYSTTGSPMAVIEIERDRKSF